MANREMQFTQKALVPVKVGGISINLYPPLDASMSAAERAHGFHVCKSNLTAAPLPPRQILNAMGQQTGQSAVVEGAVAGLLHHFQDHWTNFRNLTIISWHDSTGTIINNTTVARGRKPVGLITDKTVPWLIAASRMSSSSGFRCPSTIVVVVICLVL